MRINSSEERGTPEWYAMRAIQKMKIPQRQVIPTCFGAVFAALGAALEGEVSQVEKFIAEGQTYFEVWSHLARHHAQLISADSHQTVQDISPPLITVDEPEDFDLGEDDL